jgi:hypothetical protein
VNLYFKFINKNFSIFIGIILLFYLFTNFFFFLIGGYFNADLPVEVREFATISSILYFKEGNNPFSLESFPLFINAYSAIWPFLISKVLILLDIKNISVIIIFSRSFTFIFAILTLIFFYYNYKKKIPFNLIIFLSTFFFISITEKISLGAWSLGLGVSLYFLATLLCLQSKNRKYYVISSILIILSAHLKFYFFLGFFIILSNYYKNILTKDYLISNFVIATFLILIIILHLLFFPSYYYIAIWSQIWSTKLIEYKFFDFIISRKFFSELLYFLKIYIYLLILFVYLFFKDFNRIFFKVNFLKISFILIPLLFLIFKLWYNWGNFGMYTNNLLIPLLISLIANKEFSHTYIKKFKYFFNRFIIVLIFFPLYTPIYNYSFTGSIEYNKYLEIKKNINFIKKFYLKNNKENFYFDFTNIFISNSNHQLFFNGNSEFMNAQSIKDMNNTFLKKIMKSENIYDSYVKNYEIGLKEIKIKYNYIICSYICFDKASYHYISGDFIGVKSNFNYNQIKIFKFTNISGQTYDVRILKISN